MVCAHARIRVCERLSRVVCARHVRVYVHAQTVDSSLAGTDGGREGEGQRAGERERENGRERERERERERQNMRDGGGGIRQGITPCYWTGLVR